MTAHKLMEGVPSPDAEKKGLAKEPENLTDPVDDGGPSMADLFWARDTLACMDTSDTDIARATLILSHEKGQEFLRIDADVEATMRESSLSEEQIGRPLDWEGFGGIAVVRRTFVPPKPRSVRSQDRGICTFSALEDWGERDRGSSRDLSPTFKALRFCIDGREAELLPSCRVREAMLIVLSGRCTVSLEGGGHVELGDGNHRTTWIGTLGGGSPWVPRCFVAPHGGSVTGLLVLASEGGVRTSKSGDGHIRIDEEPTTDARLEAFRSGSTRMGVTCPYPFSVSVGNEAHEWVRMLPEIPDLATYPHLEGVTLGNLSAPKEDPAWRRLIAGPRRKRVSRLIYRVLELPAGGALREISLAKHAGAELIVPIVGSITGYFAGRGAGEGESQHVRWTAIHGGSPDAVRAWAECSSHRNGRFEPDIAMLQSAEVFHGFATRATTSIALFFGIASLDWVARKEPMRDARSEVRRA